MQCNVMDTIFWLSPSTESCNWIYIMSKSIAPLINCPTNQLPHQSIAQPINCPPINCSTNQLPHHSNAQPINCPPINYSITQLPNQSIAPTFKCPTNQLSHHSIAPPINCSGTKQYTDCWWYNPKYSNIKNKIWIENRIELLTYKYERCGCLATCSVTVPRYRMLMPLKLITTTFRHEQIIQD